MSAPAAASSSAISRPMRRAPPVISTAFPVSGWLVIEDFQKPLGLRTRLAKLVLGIGRGGAIGLLLLRVLVRIRVVVLVVLLIGTGLVVMLVD